MQKRTQKELERNHEKQSRNTSEEDASLQNTAVRAVTRPGTPELAGEGLRRSPRTNCPSSSTSLTASLALQVSSSSS